MTTYDDFLRRCSRSRDTIEAVVADNCRFDERAGTGRWQRFESVLSDLAASRDAVGWQDWTDADRLHLERYCNVLHPSVPDAFLDINQDAWLDGLSDNRILVRIEALDRPFQNVVNILGLDDLNDLLQRADGGDVGAAGTVQLFFDTWNRIRDARPTFAAFYDEVQQESDDEDWPHALRDRLGIGLGPYGDTPRPVALMRYPLADVYSAQGRQQLSSACAVPTVLDGGMHQFFFPVPREHPYGATLHLQPDRADTLTAEIVHCRIDYRRDHLYRLGTITRPHRLDENRLRETRDLHLLALQGACGREDFGETFEGRT